MADSAISQYLSKIINAVYGEDVRQAIYNSISQCYSDVNSPQLTTKAIAAAVQEKIDDGTIAALSIADGTITKEKFAADALDDIKVKAVFNEICGDLSFSVQDVLASSYPVGFENATVYADMNRNTKTGELEASAKKYSVTDWFTLPEGVYVVTPVFVNDGTNYGTIHPSIYEKWKDGDFIGERRVKADSSGAAGSGTKSILTADTRKLYSFAMPTAAISSVAPVRNTESAMDMVVIDFADLVGTDKDISDSFLRFNISDLVPVTDLSTLTLCKPLVFPEKDDLYINPVSVWFGYHTQYLYQNSEGGVCFSIRSTSISAGQFVIAIR